MLFSRAGNIFISPPLVYLNIDRLRVGTFNGYRFLYGYEVVKILFGFISFCFAVQVSHAIDPVKRWGQLQVKGNQLCSESGEPVSLRGVSYGWHNLWPRFTISIPLHG